MEITLAGISITTRRVPLNADSPIVCRVLAEANVTETSEYAYSNAPLPIDVTLAGIRIDTSGVHANADSPIVSSVLPEANSTDVSEYE